MRVLSMGETVRLFCGVAELAAAVESVGGVVVVVVGVDMLDESVPVVVVLAFGGVVVVAELSVCWLCVGVGAGAPVPSCVESVVGVAVVDGDAIDDESVVVVDDGVVVVVPIAESVVVDEDGVVIDEESVVVEDDGVVVIEDESVVVVVDEDGVVIDEESVVVEDDGVVVIEDESVVVGDVVTSPVDVACAPSFDTRMWLLVWPSTTAGERAIAAIAMSLIFMSSP
jgi:hypothetical protein